MKILLATDGTRYSQEAARQCRKIMDRFDEAGVKVITVIDEIMPIMTEPFIQPEQLRAEIEKEIRKTAERVVSEAEKILGSGERVETEIIEGPPKKMITAEARNWGADLIIVGSHGQGFWSRALLGSVTGAVVNQADCSVLVVKIPDEKIAGDEAVES